MGASKTYITIPWVSNNNGKFKKILVQFKLNSKIELLKFGASFKFSQIFFYFSTFFPGLTFLVTLNEWSILYDSLCIFQLENV